MRADLRGTSEARSSNHTDAIGWGYGEGMRMMKTESDQRRGWVTKSPPLGAFINASDSLSAKIERSGRLGCSYQ